MYCIVFSGRLLDGYDPQVVRKAVASRLNLDARQVERLFCGERVVLKKGVTEDSGRLYLTVLHRLGLDAGMARIPRAADTVQALATFKIVFWGRILDGFDRAAVMQAAAVRLKAAPAQLERMFNGDKAVLKRGVSSDVGTRYVVELARIGMQIDLEVETAAKPVPAPAQIVIPKAASVPAAERQAGFRRHDDEAYAGLLQTQFELPGTADYAEEMESVPGVMAGSIVAESSYSAALRPVAQASEQRGVAPTPAARSSQPIVVPTPVAAVEYVRCEQCGHRQTPGSRCRVCGTEMRRASPRPLIPMDASAYASPTTVMGNMPPALMRSSVAAVQTKPRDDLRSLLRKQTRSDRKQSKKPGLKLSAPTLIGIAFVITVVLWAAF